MFRSLTIVLTVALLLVGFAALTAVAQAPETFVYQGKLTDASGVPITSNVSVRFAVYSLASGGSILWQTTESITPDDNGVFTVELGPVPNTLFNGSTRYLGLKVGVDPEMMPRQVIASSPYAQFSSGLSGANYGANANPNALEPLTSSGQSFASVTLNAPTAGFAIVTAEALAFIVHSIGQFDNIIFKLSTTAGDVNTPSHQVSVVRIPDTWPTNGQRYVVPVSITHMFPVSAGNNTFHLNALESTSTGDDYLLAPNVTAIFVPFRYGVSSLAPVESLNDDTPDLMLSEPEGDER